MRSKTGYQCGLCPKKFDDPVAFTLHTNEHVTVVTEPAPMYYLCNLEHDIVDTALDLEEALAKQSEDPSIVYLTHRVAMMKIRNRAKRATGTPGIPLD